MIVECRFCHARFRLDDSLFRDSKGVRVRCRKCGEITAVRNPKISFSPQPGEMRSAPLPSRPRGPAPKEKDIVPPFPPPLPSSRAVSHPEPKNIVSPTEKAAVPGRREPSPAEKGIGMGMPPPRDAPPPGTGMPSGQPSVDAVLSRKIASQRPVYRLIPPKPLRSRPGFLIAVLLFLLLIAGAGYLGFTPAGNELLDRISHDVESIWPGSGDAVPRYAIGGVSAYYVPISTSEKYFVLEGKVMNGGKAVGKGIRIRVTLLNGNSRDIAEKTIYAGKVFTDKELRQMDRESMEQAMSRRPDEYFDNRDLLPDKSLPFMAVFFDLKESVASYQVTAIDSW